MPPAAPALKELVQFLARQLVNNPDPIEVKEVHGDTASVLELRVAKEDLGRVIGKQGRTQVDPYHSECSRRAHQSQDRLEIIEEE
jgi:hypothetical protein